MLDDVLKIYMTHLFYNTKSYSKVTSLHRLTIPSYNKSYKQLLSNNYLRYTNRYHTPI